MSTHPLAIPEVLTLVGKCLPHLIPDYFFGQPHCIFAPADLLACCLVSRFWRATLLPVLWRDYNHQAMFFVPVAILLKNSVYFRTYRGSNIFLEDGSTKSFGHKYSFDTWNSIEIRQPLQPRAPKPSACKGLHSLYLYEKRPRVRGASIATADPSVAFEPSSSIITANNAWLRKLTWDWNGFYQRLYPRMEYHLAAYIAPAFAACTNLTDLALLNMRITSVEVLWSVLSPISAQLTRLNLRGVSFDEYSFQDRKSNQDTQAWLLPRVTELAISLSAREAVAYRTEHNPAQDISLPDGGCNLREERIIRACPQLCQLTVLMDTGYNFNRLNVTLLGLPGRFPHLRTLTSETPNSDIKGLAKLLGATGSLRLEELDVVCVDLIYSVQEVSRAIVQAHRNTLTRLCLRIEPESVRTEQPLRRREDRVDRKEFFIEESRDMGYHLRRLLEAMPELKRVEVMDKSYSRIVSVVLDALVAGPVEQGSSGNAVYHGRRDAERGSSMCAWICHGLESLSFQGFAPLKSDVGKTNRAHVSERRLEHGWRAMFSVDMEEDCLESLQAFFAHVSPILPKLKEIEEIDLKCVRYNRWSE